MDEWICVYRWWRDSILCNSIRFNSIQLITNSKFLSSRSRARQDKSATQRRTHCLEHSTGDTVQRIQGKGREENHKDD